jgi:alcohol dehydrogenase class IV
VADQFIIPKKILYGNHALSQAGAYLKELGSNALIITDQTMISSGNVAKLTQILNEADISFEVFAKINSEPTDEMVFHGIQYYDKMNCDFLVGLGGGSVIDAMKAIGAMKTHPGKLPDYLGKEFKGPLPNLVAIPTTAGTGSEATQYTIILDTKNNVKMLLKGAGLIPSLAVVDPELTISAPPKITAYAGIDALAHAIEAYTSRKAQPLSDQFALSACKRIFSSLKNAFVNGTDMEARSQMALASLEAGIAFNNSSVTIVHGMSRPIGAIFHVPHGLSNAMLLENCLSFAVKGSEKRFADIARVTGVTSEHVTDSQGGEALIYAIRNLCYELDIPSLKSYGIDKYKYFTVLDKMAEDALKSGSPANTLRTPCKKEIIKIYESLWG